MALTFQILPERGIVYVKYTGFLRLSESFDRLAEYRASPDYSPAQKHLVDLTEITDFERDFTKIMQLQATKIEMVANDITPTILTYYAPTKIGQAAARTALKSWEGLPHVVPLMAKTESQALSLIGAGVESLDALLQSA